MADNSTSGLLASVAAYKYNPAAIASAAVNLVSAATSGQLDFVDVSNPAILCIESAAVLTAGFMQENATTTRRQYPYSAQTIEDLYPHMSDKDYVDRFAVPATAEFLFFFDYNELLTKLVVDPNDNGISKVTIPRDTYITVASTVFTLEYPIEIRQLAHGGLQIVYDVSQDSPFGELQTNIIDWQLLNAPTSDTQTVQQLVGFAVTLKQFAIATKSYPVTKSTGFSVSVPFTDQYFYTRVWVDNGDGTFTEMATTYTDTIYDPNTLTAVLTVLDGTVTVKIPQVYLTTGLVSKNVRIDMYSTKGPISLTMVNYTADQFVVSYRALNPAENDEFVAPMNTLHTCKVYSSDQVAGGANAMTFDELYTRVVSNAIGSPKLPITNTQITAALSRAGYTVVKNIDTITNRNFLATRSMPDPVASELITAAAAGICTLVTKLSDAVALETVIDNGDYITITPDTLYKVTGSTLALVPSAEADLLATLTPDQLAIAVNAQSYMYTPFHYVFDSSNNEFAVRPYYLDAPVINSKSFVAENDSTLLSVATDSFSIFRTKTGYIIEISTKSSDDWKALDDDQVNVQLSYIPTGDTDRAYVLGVQVGKDSVTNERIYHFTIDTNYAIHADNQLQITSLQMYDQSARVIELPLTQTLDLLYSTTKIRGSQWQQSTIDPLLGYFQLPDNSYAISQEQLNTTFGYYLGSLWARSRSVVSASDYQTYAVDVPATYSEDVYQLDPATGAKFSIVNGQVVYNKLHSKGDTVVDDHGQVVYKYRKGDIKLDAYGNPIILNNRGMQRQIDMFMVEGAYKFATNQVTIDYRTTLTNTVLQWVTKDLPNMDNNLLEQTELFFYPTTTVGQVDVIFSAGLQTTIDALQEFQVTLSVKSAVYNNADLRAAITTKTVKSLSSSLNNVKVSISDMIDALRTQYGNDVISIDLKGLGGSSNLNVVTLLDDSKQLSLKKVLIARNDDTLGLQEGVTVDFVLHQVTIASA